MDINFEAKYLNITWANSEAASKIEESSLIPIDIISKSKCQLETTAYKRGTARVGFRILSGQKINKPYFENGVEKIYLRPVVNNLTGDTWWIEDGEWHQEKKTRLFAMYRTAGLIILHIEDVICEIQVSPSSFTSAQLETYLNDFKNDFWELILDERSYIKGEAKQKKNSILDSSALLVISKFEEYATCVVENPKKELREIQSVKNYKKVRPVPRTFMEISTTGIQKVHSSRDYQESYNVAENQYVLYAVNRVLTLVKQMSAVSAKQEIQHKRKIDSDNKRLESFTAFKKIDRESFFNEIERLKNKRDVLKKQLTDKNQEFSRIISKQIRKEYEQDVFRGYSNFFTIGIQSNDDDDYLTFFVNKISDVNYGNSSDNGICFISFDKTIFSDIELNKGIYNIIADIKFCPSTSKDGKKILKCICKYIHSVNIEDGGIIRDINKYNKAVIERNTLKDKLELNGWMEKLTYQEIKEQEQEKQSISTLLVLNDKQCKKVIEIKEKSKPVLNKLIAIKKEMKKKKIVPNSKFPNSMTFVQNKHYQCVHKFYKEIKELSGLDENLFFALEEVELIGLVHISLLYERWCLLQIIKVLMNSFRFLPEEGWKQKLVELILNSKKNIAINFTNDDAARVIKLSYELELPSGKRPDFVLDIQSTCFPNQPIKRFILDAKFKEDLASEYSGGISALIQELYIVKNYAENNHNSVFILHPSKNSIKNRLSPLKWGKNSYYGESPMFDWELTLKHEGTFRRDHQFGAVMLSPVRDDGKPLDDLQRLIGMFLQYGMRQDRAATQLDNSQYHPVHNENIICIVCGSNNCFWEEKPTLTKGKKYHSICSECKHFSIYTHCHSCKNKLIKNGSYWTYHGTQPLNPTNVVCPVCDELL